MAQVTPNLNLTVWNLSSDKYNHEELANNFIAIDQHDHSGSGKGTQLDGATAIKDGTITSAKFGAGIINTTNIGLVIADQAVDTVQIADGAITTSKLEDITPGSPTTTGVTTTKIADSSITTAKLVPNSVTSSILLSNATNDNSRAVTTNHIKDQAITESKIAAGVVTADKIAPNAVSRGIGSANKVGDLTVATTTLPTGANDGDEILFRAAAGILWHLRYNNTYQGGCWEFVGGSSLTSTVTADVDTDGSLTAGHYPVTGTWYHRWPSTSTYFNHINIPLPGLYTTNHAHNFRGWRDNEYHADGTSNGTGLTSTFGTIQSALAIEAQTDSTPTVVGDSICSTWFYSFYRNFFTASLTNSSILVSANTGSANRVLGQIFRISDCMVNNNVPSNTSYTDDGNLQHGRISFQSLSITPVWLKNWS